MMVLRVLVKGYSIKAMDVKMIYKKKTGYILSSHSITYTIRKGK